MKHLIFFTLILVFCLNSKAQQVNSKYDFRFGVGTSLLGTGDMQTIMFENEFNMKLNKYFSIGEGLGFGKSNSGVFEQASFIQLNSNIYVSPAKNNLKNDFRFGVGLSWITTSDVYRSSATSINGQLVSAEYQLDKRNSIGFNLIMENTYTFSNKFMLGVKVFTQPYKNGDINSGILLKLGVKL